VGAARREPAQEACSAEWAELARERLGCGDEQVTQLAEARPFRVHGPVSGGHQRPQGLALSVAARRRRPLLLEHSPSGPNRVKRIGLAARAALSPQPADLEHLLALLGEEAGQASAERAGPLRSRTHAAPAHAPLRHTELPRSRSYRRPRSTRTRPRRYAPQPPRSRAHHGADQHQPRSPVHLQASRTTSSPGWRQLRCRSGSEDRWRQDCDGSRPRGGQASDQANKRAPGWHRSLRSDKSPPRHPHAGSVHKPVTNKEHRHHPDNSPRRGPNTLTVRKLGHRRFAGKALQRISWVEVCSANPPVGTATRGWAAPRANPLSGPSSPSRRERWSRPYSARPLPQRS